MLAGRQGSAQGRELEQNLSTQVSWSRQTTFLCLQALASRKRIPATSHRNFSLTMEVDGTILTWVKKEVSVRDDSRRESPDYEQKVLDFSGPMEFHCQLIL